MKLADLTDAFEGVIPSIIATLDADGMPNVSYLSQVFMVDDRHVALSNQFFSKTAANVSQTGRAALLLVDGRTGDQFALDLVFERAVESGELFDRMEAHLNALCAHDGRGMAEVMKLRGADVYRVESLRPTPSFVGPAAPEPDRPTPADRLLASSRVAQALAAQADPEAALDVTLDALVRELGFANAMVLAVDETGQSLTVLASRGYPAGGAGSEVALGVGAIGIAAETGRPVRIADLSRGRRFAGAALSSAELDRRRIIPLPGLAESLSQLAAPMIVRGEVKGVVFVEAATRFAFAAEDEQVLSLVAAQLAASLAAGPRSQDREIQPPVVAPRTGAPFKVRYYPFDDSVFIDEAYVIKGVPGRLLHHFLRAWLDEGRADFTNREVRLDPALRLPDLKDNLETRLILLKRRLDEKAAPIRLSRPGRGLIRLEVTGTPGVEVVETQG